MKAIFFAAVLVATTPALYAQDTSPLAELKNSMAGLFSASPEEQKELDAFFTSYNAGEFENIFQQQFSSKIQTIKNHKMFMENAGTAKEKTGNFLNAKATGVSSGYKTLLTTDDGTTLDSPISLSTKTRKWKAKFENGTFYLSMVFYTENGTLKLYQLSINDDQLNPSFETKL